MQSVLATCSLWISLVTFAACVAPHERVGAAPEDGQDRSSLLAAADLEAVTLRGPSRTEKVPPPPFSELFGDRAAGSRTASGSRPKSLRSRLRAPLLTGVRLSSTDGTGEFQEVVRMLRGRTGLPILTTPQARQIARESGLALDLEPSSPVSVVSLLGLFTELEPQLAWRITDGVVFVEARAERAARLTLVYYDVRDLVSTRTVFVAPRLEGGIPTDRDDGVLRTGGQSEEAVQVFDTDGLLEILRLGTDPRFWEETPRASMEVSGAGTLIVRATADVHAQIRSLLGS